MMKNKLLWVALAVVAIPIGMVAAQSSTRYVTHRIAVVGGGSAESANYSVISVFGQAAIEVASGQNFKVSGGFLFPRRQGFDVADRVWLPMIYRQVPLPADNADPDASFGGLGALTGEGASPIRVQRSSAR